MGQAATLVVLLLLGLGAAEVLVTAALLLGVVS
jgi:hypothetical protein